MDSGILFTSSKLYSGNCSENFSINDELQEIIAPGVITYIFDSHNG